MYQHNEILIVGDSFCSGRRYPHEWPQILLSHLTNQPYDANIIPRGQGFSGASWWSVRQRLIKELSQQKPRVLIICHTDSHRIPSDQDLSLNAVSVEHRVLHDQNKQGKDQKMPDQLALAGKLYYQELISFPFHTWAQQQWQLEIDRILTANDIERVVHLYCFDDGSEQNRHTFAQGVTVADPLINYRVPYEIEQAGKGISNHFTPDMNRLLAEFIADIVDNYPGNGFRLLDKIVKEKN